MHHDVEERVRRTHETFYCPAGHSNYFPGKTEESVLRDKLRNAERLRDRWRELRDEAVEERDEWKLQAKSCPFECGFRVLRKSKPENIAASLAFHLIEEHGARLPDPVIDKANVAA